MRYRLIVHIPELTGALMGGYYLLLSNRLDYGYESWGPFEAWEVGELLGGN